MLGSTSPEHGATQSGNPVILQRDEVAGHVLGREGVRVVHENAQLIAGRRQTYCTPIYCGRWPANALSLKIRPGALPVR